MVRAETRTYTIQRETKNPALAKASGLLPPSSVGRRSRIKEIAMMAKMVKMSTCGEGQGVYVWKLGLGLGVGAGMRVFGSKARW